MAENKEFRTIRGYELKNRPENKLTPAMEDYLEMMLRIGSPNGEVRVSDLARELQVKPSSVTKMNQRLVSHQLISATETNRLILTDKGRLTAEYLMKRHMIIETFLTLLGNEDPLTEIEMVEHSMTSQTVARLNLLNEFFISYPDIHEKYCNYIKEAVAHSSEENVRRLIGWESVPFSQ